MSVPQTVCQHQECQPKKHYWGWFHVIINLQPLITDKGHFFCLIVGVGNTSFNRFPYVRWWGGRILDLLWRRGRIFVKKAFSWSLLLDELESLGTMEGLPGIGRVIEENGFV